MQTTIQDRVRAHSDKTINQQIDKTTAEKIKRLSGADNSLITQRLAQLDKEWDIERALETTASSFTITGLVLGTFVNRKWLIFPGVVAAFLLQHSLQGWCPPLAVFRSLKVRTRREIDEEKFALKAMRGDFDDISKSSKPSEILAAVKKRV